MDIPKHYFHPLYQKAREHFQRVHMAQIEKGAAKYPEPLNPASWTADQLVEHAMQENVDQMHYLTALLEWIALDQARLRPVNELQAENERLKVENTTMKEALEKAQHHLAREQYMSAEDVVDSILSTIEGGKAHE